MQQQQLILQKKSLVLQILLLVLAIALGVTLAFRVFYVDHEDTTMVLRNPKFKIEVQCHHLRFLY